jgi:hypothetical protein
MKFQPSAVRNSLFILVVMLAGISATAQTTANSSATAQAAVPARITQAIDEARMVQLKGNVHPLARAEFDQGTVSNATPMKRMLLLLQRSPEQEVALQQFMAEQMSNESPNFHKWLTPEEFGKLYGPADADVQTVTAWLASQGFSGIRVNRGKTVIEFSGNVGQVRNTFRTDIHKFVVDGENRQSNISDPQIPAALTPVVAGIVSLHNFPTKSMRHLVGQFTKTADGHIEPQFTGTTNNFFALGPADFAKIYNIPAALDGTGGNIAIIGFSNINVQDARDFRALFGLPVNDPIVVLNGADPGFGGEEGEADLDVQWSGAVAPKATIHYINSEGTQTSDPLFLGAEYVVDNNSDDVMSLSFGACEAGLSAGTNAFLNTLWQQAAAQGITVTVSSGDNGTAGCDDFNSATRATTGIAVNGIASTPFNIAVGGTDFDDVGNQAAFWNQNPPPPAPPNANDPVTKLSAKGYIHEMPWNDSCAATATPTSLTTCAGAAATNIVAGSGGPSTLYTKPSFQSGITPNGIAAGDNHRYLPDVSLFASDGPQSKSFYVVCQADALPPGSSPSCAATGPFSFFGVGGTSASAPSFAGIIALIGQSEATAGRSRRQGNANLVLYKIAQTAANSCNSTTQPLAPPATCVFYDVTKGNNAVPCAGASPNCSSTVAGTNGVLVTVNGATKTPAFTAAAGTGIPSYDLATGLGTVNVANLATAWGTAIGAFKGSVTSLKINGATTPVNITHGTAVTATVTVGPKSPATGIPTGDVSVLGPFSATQKNGGNNDGTLAGGTVTLNGVILPGGTYNATAHYAGDGTFASSDDLTGVPVVVGKENSTLQMGIVTFNTANAITSDNATAFGYGSPYILRFDILNSTGTATNCHPLTTGISTGCAIDATGTVIITDNGNPLDGGTFNINSEGHSEDQPIQLTGGPHALVATYSGDNSYNPPAVPVTDNVTVGLAATTTVLTPAAATVLANQSTTLSVAISSQSNSSIGTTGNVTFKDGTTTIGTAAAVPVGAGTVGAGGTAVLNTSFATTGVHALTAVYAGDANYTTSTSATVNVTVNNNPVPTVTTISPTSGTAGGPAFALTVNGTNFVSTSKVTFGANGGLVPTSVTPTQILVNIPASAIAAVSTPIVFVTNPSPGGGPSNSVNFTVNSGGTFTVGGGAVTVTAGASGTSTITVTPSGGFLGMVNVTCPAAGLPPGVTCSPNPLAINVTTAAAATGQLTVSVAAPSTTLTASAAPTAHTLYAAGVMPSSGSKGWWMLSVGTGLAAVMFLLFLPGRKKYRAALGLGLVCVLSFALGCGGSGGGGGGGPVVTTTSITVNNAKLASNDPTGFRFTINVNASVGANGQVQLFDGATALGTGVAASNGTVTITSAGLAPGTHSISAHYLGDSKTKASNSGTLNVTSTGTTTFAITTTPAASNGSPTVNVTIN